MNGLVPADEGEQESATAFDQSLVLVQDGEGDLHVVGVGRLTTGRALPSAAAAAVEVDWVLLLDELPASFEWCEGPCPKSERY